MCQVREEREGGRLSLTSCTMILSFWMKISAIGIYTGARYMYYGWVWLTRLYAVVTMFGLQLARHSGYQEGGRGRRERERRR